MQTIRALVVSLTAIVAIVLGPLQATISPSSMQAPTQSTAITEMGQNNGVWLCRWMPYLSYICCCNRPR